MINATNTTESEIPFSPTFLAVLIVFKCLCFVCGVLGNLGVIIYNLFMNNNKTPTSYLITNLAFADLLTCLSVYPIWVTEFIMMLSRKHSNQYQVFFCKFTNSVNLVLVSISSLTLLSIAFDRYIFISRPLRYPLMMTWKKTCRILLSIWICAVLYCPVLAFFTESTDVRAACSLSPIVSLIAAVIYILTPFVFIFYLNHKIFKVAMVHLRRIRSENNRFMPSASGLENSNGFRIKRELKTIKTFAIVVGAFVICFFPFSMTTLLQSLVGNFMSQSVWILLGDLALMNSILNPIIYGMRHNEYKNCYRQLAGVFCNRLQR